MEIIKKQKHQDIKKKKRIEWVDLDLWVTIIGSQPNLIRDVHWWEI